MNAESLHIGTNIFVDAYYGDLPDLISCATDAAKLSTLAATRNFAAKQLINLNADFDKIDAAITDSARRLGSGDYFILTISSHGMVDDQATTTGWALHDQVVKRHGPAPSVDAWLARFAAGVRVLVIANCCFSGDTQEPTALALPRASVRKIVAKHRREVGAKSDWAFMRVFESAVDFVRAPSIKAFVIFVSACGANQIALDGSVSTDPTVFGKRLLGVLSPPNYTTFDNFIELLKMPVDPDRIPEMLTLDPRSQDFEALGPYRSAPAH
jgi:hypothetical protein